MDMDNQEITQENITQAWAWFISKPLEGYERGFIRSEGCDYYTACERQRNNGYVHGLTYPESIVELSNMIGGHFDRNKAISRLCDEIKSLLS